jgi:hypothetical protein
MNYSFKWGYRLSLLLLALFQSMYMFSQSYSTGVVNLSSTAGLAMTAQIDIETQVTLTLTGPSGRWFALGFDAGSMASGTDIVGVHSASGLTAFDCHLTGYSAPVTDPQQNWTIVSDLESGGIRSIVATRALNTGDVNDYIFSSTPSTIGLIWARSSTASYGYSYHGGGNRGVTFATFSLVQPPAPPTGSANQVLCAGATIAQLNASGTAINWYSNPSGGAPLPSSTPLVNGNTYYATQTVNGLESINRLAVAVTLTNPPSAPSTINGLVDFCYNGSGQQYNVTSSSSATSYLWNTPVGTTGSSVGTNINLLFSPSFQSGTLSVQAENNCGQSAPTSIIINQHLPSSATLTISSCTPYSFNGQTFTQSGTYNYQGTTIWGCDSTIVLNLTVSSSILENEVVDACGSYSWNDQTFFSSGNYTDTLPAPNGCDTIVTLDLTIHPIESIVIDTTVVGNFIWNGQEYTSSGTYTQVFNSEFGCDSTVTINLILIAGGLNDSEQPIYIYPNPVGCERQLFLNELYNEAHYFITNLEGQIVQNGQSNGNIMLQNSLQSGIYFLKVQNSTFKLLLQ